MAAAVAQQLWVPRDVGPADPEVNNERFKELEGFLEHASAENRMLRREIEDLGYVVYGELGSDRAKVDLKIETVRTLIQKARIVWQEDPIGNRASTLINEFAFRDGVVWPDGKDPGIREVIRNFIGHPQNKEVLFSQAALHQNSNELQCCSNFYFLAFLGDNGSVRLGLLEPEMVVNMLHNPNDKTQVLYYVVEEPEMRWSFEKDQYVPVINAGKVVVKKYYYEHWENVRLAKEDAKANSQLKPLPIIPDGRLKPGLVYHAFTNKRRGQKFGYPTIHMAQKWITANNDVLAAQIEKEKAAASILMKAKVQGSPGQLMRNAVQRMGRSGQMGSASSGFDGIPGPKAASIIHENEAITHEPFSIDTHSQALQTFIGLLRAQASAAYGLPDHWLGGTNALALAGATSIEIPVARRIESYQKVWFDIICWAIDLAIWWAREKSVIPKVSPQESTETMERPELNHAGTAMDGLSIPNNDYEFSMPDMDEASLGEFLAGIGNVARTFDANGTNGTFTRELIPPVLKRLSFRDPFGARDRMFPKGYIDPLVKLMIAQQEAALAASEAEAEAPSGEVPSAPSDGTGAPAKSRGVPEGDPVPGAGGLGKTGVKSRPSSVSQPETVHSRSALPHTFHQRGRGVADALDQAFNQNVAQVIMSRVRQPTGVA